MNRAVIYARYSSNSQSEQSIDGQLRVCGEYAKSKGLNIVNTYIDRAISGKTTTRISFQNLIGDASKNLFNHVIVYKTDRFSRNKYDSAVYKKQLRDLGIKLHYAAENIPDGAEGVILESLMEGLAEYYSLELSQKIKRGMHESALKCKSTGGGRSLGYTSDDDKNIIIHESEAKAVITVFHMFIAKHSHASICNYLNNLGLKTARGSEFNKNSVTRIITNEKYTGVYKYGDIKVEDGIPAIISKEVYYMAKQEMENRKNNRQAKSERANYILSNKLICNECQSRMVGVSGTGKSGNKWYYYYCKNARARKTCTKKPVRTDWLENFIIDSTSKYVLQPDTLTYLLDKLCELQKSKESIKNKELQHFTKLLNDNKIAQKNILKAIESGVLSESLISRLADLEKEYKNIETELYYYNINNTSIDRDKIEYYLTSHLFLNKTPDNRERILKSFISKVYLSDDKVIIYYNINKGAGLHSSELKLINNSDGFDQTPVWWR